MKPNEGINSKLVMLLAVMAGVSVANLYYCQPLLNMIREDMELTEFLVNFMPVSTQIGYALGLLFIIPMGDLYNRKTTILTCFSLLVASLLCIAFAQNAAMLLAGAFVTGFCSVAPQVFMPFVSQYARPEEKERKVGFILSGLLCGILGSRVVSGYVGHLFGWRSMYIIAAVMIVASALVLMKAFPYVEPTFKGKFSNLMSSILKLCKQYPSALRYSIRAGITFGSFLCLWACLAFRVKEAPFFQGSDVVGLLSICGIAGALTASNAGKYISRIGVERMNIIGASLILLAWLTLAFTHNHYIGLIAGIIIIDIGMQCVQLSNQSATLKLCGEASSRMNTIYMVCYFIGGSIGTFAAGALWSLMGWQGTVLAGISLISIAAIFSCVTKNNLR
ncbi:MAG: MFS transporter [Prevotellaceae bacterium]|nr:MFS transporter [Candidatus Minthosoma caballi]